MPIVLYIARAILQRQILFVRLSMCKMSKTLCLPVLLFANHLCDASVIDSQVRFLRVQQYTPGGTRIRCSPIAYCNLSSQHAGKKALFTTALLYDSYMLFDVHSLFTTVAMHLGRSSSNWTIHITCRSYIAVVVAIAPDLRPTGSDRQCWCPPPQSSGYMEEKC